MKVLVTGAAGYIGSVLCPMLREAGLQVTALDIRPGEGITLFDAAKDELPLDGIDVVIPLAAVVGAPACAKDPVLARKVIVGSAQQIAERLDGRGCVYLTTDSGYAPSNNAHHDDPFYPRSEYAKLKHEAAETLREQGAVVFRLASLFGGSPSMRDDLLAHWMVKKTLEDRKLPNITEPNARRAFVHVRDVCASVVKALPGRSYFSAYNLTSPDRMTKHDLAIAVALAIGVEPDYVTMKAIFERDPDGRDFWLDGGVWPSWRRLSAEIPRLVEYYRSRT